MKRLQKSRRLGRTVFPLLGSLLIRSIGATCSVDFNDPLGVMKDPRRPPYLFAFWHSRLFLLPYLYNLAVRDRQLAALISASRDGDLIAEAARRLGILAARGSSSRQGDRGIREMIRAFKENGHDLGITPDGPRGPALVVQRGVIHLAQATGAAIIPLGCEYADKWELNSWDRFQIPRPFTHCRIQFYQPISVPKDADKDELERLRQALERVLQASASPSDNTGTTSQNC